MVIAADGTKWSCVSCLKGHRVSGCNHTDRELKLVPKKGRPVTQCHHCRQERKKRSAHVKCDCAEPEKPHHSKEKCIHLREAEDRIKTAHFDDPIHHDKDIAHMAAVAEEQGCCCHHGGKCSCALLRKDSTDGDAPIPSRSKSTLSKPRLESTRSDSSVATVFSDGHHRLTHRNHAAHECGMPYKIPMSRARTEQHFSSGMRRSVDNLSLVSTSAPLNPDFQSPMSIQTMQSQNQPTKVEQTSPRDMAQLFGSAGGLNPNRVGVLDFAGIDTTPVDNTDIHDGSTFPLENAVDTNISPDFDEWSAFDSNDLLNLSNSDQFGLATSSTDAVNLAQPALTAASSGTQSEIDEIPAIEDVFTNGMPSIQETTDFNPSTNSFDPTSQVNRRSLPPNFFGNIDFSVPVMNDGWQAQLLDTDNSIFGKAIQDLGFGDPWESSNNSSKASFGNVVSTERSLSSSGAANVDVLKQLFPDMDLDSQYAPSSPRQYPAASYADQAGDSADTLNATTSQPPARSISGQAWADGSMSIPDDSYATGFVRSS